MIRFLFAAYLILPLTIQSAPYQESERDELAMVFNGGDLRTGLLLGILAGFEEQGMVPDMIIATCGGALAAMVAHTIQSNEDRLAFVASPGFYQVLREVKFNEKFDSVGKAFGLVLKFYSVYGTFNIIPDIFNEYIMEVPMSMGLDPITEEFSPQGEIPVIMVSAKVLYQQRDAQKWRRGRKLFQQVLFTDDSTAQRLQGLTSHFSQQKNSPIAPQVEVITTATLDDAMRTSLVEPFWMVPKEIDGQQFIGGAIDLYPIELAKRLAKKIVMLQNLPFDFMAMGAINGAYRIDMSKRYQKVFTERRDDIDYLIDTRDFPNEQGFDIGIKKLKLYYDLPDDYESYRKRVHWQFEYGRRKAIEAINAISHHGLPKSLWDRHRE